MRVSGPVSSAIWSAALHGLLLLCAAAPAVRASAEQASDTELPPIAEARPPADDPCQREPIENTPESCWTPRPRFFSNFYFAADVGAMTVDESTQRRVGLGPGLGYQLRIGFGFWDHLLINLMVGGLMFDDRQSFSEVIVECGPTLSGLACGEPFSDSSDVNAIFLGLEAGFQQRFRLLNWLSLSVGAMLGLLETTDDLTRTVGCEGCREVKLEAEADGLYLCPLLRVTFGRLGMLGAVARSQWFVTGDMLHMSTLGIELLYP